MCSSFIPIAVLGCNSEVAPGTLTQPWVDQPVPVAAGMWQLAAYTARRQEEKVDG